MSIDKDDVGSCLVVSVVAVIIAALVAGFFYVMTLLTHLVLTEVFSLNVSRWASFALFMLIVIILGVLKPLVTINKD